MVRWEANGTEAHYRTFVVSTPRLTDANFLAAAARCSRRSGGRRTGRRPTTAHCSSRVCPDGFSPATPPPLLSPQVRWEANGTEADYRTGADAKFDLAVEFASTPYIAEGAVVTWRFL